MVFQRYLTIKTRIAMTEKELYAAPSTVVLELRSEGIVCSSTRGTLADPDDYVWGGDPFVF
jgi:hypothetical protein